MCSRYYIYSLILYWIIGLGTYVDFRFVCALVKIDPNMKSKRCFRLTIGKSLWLLFTVFWVKRLILNMCPSDSLRFVSPKHVTSRHVQAPSSKFKVLSQSIYLHYKWIWKYYFILINIKKSVSILIIISVNLKVNHIIFLITFLTAKVSKKLLNRFITTKQKWSFLFPPANFA